MVDKNAEGFVEDYTAKTILLERQVRAIITYSVAIHNELTEATRGVRYDQASGSYSYMVASRDSLQVVSAGAKAF